MFSGPDPLHPALVHFPIVLLLLGAVIAWVAVFVRRGALPCIAAAFLVLGAIGAVAATWSGTVAEHRIAPLPTAAEDIFERHEAQGKLTRLLALLAAVSATGAAVLGRFPRTAQVAALVAAGLALAAAISVVRTGRLGGELVYRHGVGVRIPDRASSGD